AHGLYISSGPLSGGAGASLGAANACRSGLRVANSAGALKMFASCAAEMRSASAEMPATKVRGAATTWMAPTKVRTATTTGMTTATAGKPRLCSGDQQHADRNNHRQNTACPSHKDASPMANS